MAQFWLCSSPEINARDSEGNTALMISVTSQNLEFSRLLLEHKADVNANNKEGHTALTEYLAQAGHGYRKVDPEILKLMIDEGADVNEGNWHGSKALVLALDAPEQFAFQLLLDAGADPNGKDECGRTCLHHAAWKDDSYTCKSIEILLEAGADLEIRDQYGETPLLTSFTRANIHTAELLLRKGVKIDFAALKSYDREPPILVTVQDTGIEGLLGSFMQSDHQNRPAEGCDKQVSAKVAKASFTKEITDFLLQDGISMEIKRFSSRSARRASKTAFLITAPSSAAVDIVDSLMRAGVKTDITAAAEERTLIKAVEQRVKAPTPCPEWVRFSTWKTYQNLLEKTAQNTMLIAAELRSQSDGNVQLLFLWGPSWELIQQMVASLESSTGAGGHWWRGWQLSCEETDYEDLYSPEIEIDWEYDDDYETHYEWSYEVGHESSDFRSRDKRWEGRRKANRLEEQLRSWLGLDHQSVMIDDDIVEDEK